MSETRLWELYSAHITVDRLVAGIPSQEKPLAAWLEVNKAPEEAAAEQSAAQAALTDEEAMHSVVFFRNAEGVPCYEARCLKAALKEAANVVKTIAGKKNYRARLAERVFTGPPGPRLHPITSPIQSGERPISVMTLQGPRTSLKRFEYADDVSISFIIGVLRDPSYPIKIDDLRLLMEYAQVGGIGSDRSQGAGTFTLHDLVAVDAAEPAEPVAAAAG